MFRFTAPRLHASDLRVRRNLLGGLVDRSLVSSFLASGFAPEAKPIRSSRFLRATVYLIADSRRQRASRLSRDSMRLI